MNANELADAMQGVISVLNVHHEKDCLFIANDAQYMLRQQQNEIEDLKNANRFIQNFAEEQHQRAVALEMRELTDEEIQEVAHGFGAIGWMGDTTYEFARAILRKAQEK
jgi:hypothetical protein